MHYLLSEYAKYPWEINTAELQVSIRLISIQ